MLLIIKKIAGGQSILRILMNLGFREETVRGVVVDVGGGRSPDYFEYFRQEHLISCTPVDASLGAIDFEKDPLPFPEQYADTVICANVLEHIYNYKFLLSEIHRITKKGGKFLGFVPFLIQYHPDPHDYFRYTKEALEKIVQEAGFKDVCIRSIGGGPFLVNFNNIMLSVPRIVRIILFPIYAALDWLMLAVRPKVRIRYPLGFIFTAKNI